MELFLVVEHGEKLYLVDQHAAHERVIYDRLRGGASGQELLFPVRLEFEPEAEAVIEEKREALGRLGIELERRDGGWELVTIPASVSMDAESLAALLMDLLDRPSDFERELYASLSCRSAVMEGDRIAPATAMEIIRGVLGLDNARCPHGRPVWIEWSRDELARLVGRSQ
jgi:DNA mismatch repair protein MutL